jgi:UMF1 family MFS transporter
MLYFLKDKYMSKIKLWYLYDFANSFASSVIIFYFPLILLEKGASDTWIGISTIVSTTLLLIFYPSLGRKADKGQKIRMNYIKISSFLMVISLIALAFITNNSENSYTFWVLTMLSFLYILFQVAFQGSYVFYSAFMQDFENEGKHKNKISSLGMGLGQLGNAVSIGVMGAFVVGGTLTLFGFSGKSLALLLGAFIFTVLGYPFLRQKIKEDKDEKILEQKSVFSLFEFSNKILNNKKIFYYLIGYLLIADSISTLQIYLTLYLKNVFGFDEKMSSLAGAISLFCLFLTCMVLGALSTKIDNKAGNLAEENKNKTLIVSAFIYVAVFLLFGLAPKTYFFAFISIALAGVAYGLFFPLARSIYSDIVPKESQAEYFSSFVIFERVATIFGPLVWIFVFWLLNDYDTATRYRANVIVLSLIALLGIFFIKKSFRVQK